MTTFKELCEGKMWRAMEAVVQGLQQQNLIPCNAIDFRTFGMYCDKGNKAYCNAATAGIQYLLQYKFGSDIENREAKILLSETSVTDYERFEKALDDFSAGRIGTLLHYFELNERIFWGLPAMNNNNWRAVLPEYIKSMLYYKKLNK